MFLQLVRLEDNNRSTIGTLHVNGEFECFTLEDTYNEPKVYGKTRVPAGEYNIKLRTVGGMTQKYANKYTNHKGMLWLHDVPGFEYIYIHTGNHAGHTDGCVLVGQGCDSATGSISKSRLAYEKLYTAIITDLDNGNDVTIQII